MPTFLPFLIATGFILASCFFKGFARWGNGGPNLTPDDFYFGMETSMVALLLVLEPTWDGSSPFIQKPSWVPHAAGAASFLSLLTCTVLARFISGGATGAKYWSCWIGGNLLGLLCAGLTIWAKWPIPKL
jgi:hypothetical protein